MSALASVLPFLAALKKQVPDFSGMTADSPDPNDMTDQVNRQSMVAAAQQPPMGPPMASSIPQQDPQPDMSIGAPPQPQQPPPNPVGDIAQSMTQGAAPKYRPTKAHELVDILRGGIVGGLAGVEQNSQTYAQTGRNAGFGGGVAGAIQLPFQQAYQRGELGKQAAQTELLKQQAQEVNVPGYGNMPTGLAKVLFPSLIRGQATLGAADIGAKGRIGAAQVTAGKPVVVPGRGLYQKDENGQYQPVQGAEVPQVLVTAEEAQTLGHPELANQEIDMGRYSQLLRGVSSQNVPVQGAAGASLVNKNTAKTTPLGLGSPGVAVAMARPVQVADPNNPGNVTYTTAGNAIGQGAMSPQSGVSQGARAVTKSAIAGPIGNEINAFNTSIAHADLLQKAAAALGNGDVQALSGLKNSFKNAFGSSGPVTAQVIADAYTRETNKMLSGNHITDSEINAIGKTIDPNRQSPAQMVSVIGAYRALAASKMQQRQNQVTQGQQGKANFPQQNQFTVTDPAGGIHTFKDQQSADQFKAAIGIK